MSWVRVTVSVVALGLCALAAGAAPSFGASAARSVSSTFSCPAAPSGWTSAPSGPQVWGPQQDPGIFAETVACFYENSQEESLNISAEFALPTDLNPIGDFDLGCGSRGAISWDPSTREYRATSNDRWSYAGFQDASNIVPASDVPAFEAVSRSLLQSVAGAAHTCSLKTVPTQPTDDWFWDFEFSMSGKGFVALGGIGSKIPQPGASPIPDATFETKGATITPKVISVHAPLVPISILENGKKYNVTIRILHGLSFKYKTLPSGAAANGAFSATVKVTHSTEPTCKRGATGKLTVTSEPQTFALNLCGALFRHPVRNATVTVEPS